MLIDEKGTGWSHQICRGSRESTKDQGIIDMH